MSQDDWDALAERARCAPKPVRTWPPAVLPDIVEARYRRHVTDRAQALGVTERNLAAHLELDALDPPRQEIA